MAPIQVGNAPCSWGTLEFEGLQGERIGYAQMLDELVSTGYTATELGDWGFMPTEPESLRQEIEGRHLRMLGAYVGVAFNEPHQVPDGQSVAVKTAKLLAQAFPGHPPWIILADDNGKVPIRAENAGRISPEMSLSADQWKSFARNVESVARVVREETGLQALFHHHCAGFVETPEEIHHLLDLTDPCLVNLVFDTGHYVFGCGPEGPQDVLQAMKGLQERIHYVHFKDCSLDVASQSRENSWDYFNALRRGVFCELGKGSVDFKGILDWLQARSYEGWVLVEQDVLPGMGRPRESAQRNRQYLKSIGL